MNLENKDLPGLYIAADKLAIDSQKNYYLCLKLYLSLLIVAAAVSFGAGAIDDKVAKIIGAGASAFFFLFTLGILIGLRMQKPDDTWYNGRAVAESAKTRAWRWMMCAEPYGSSEKDDSGVSNRFIDDLKMILDQNLILAAKLSADDVTKPPISDVMKRVRSLPVEERSEIYRSERCEDQLKFYSSKEAFNRSRAKLWFWISVCLHAAAIVMMLIRIVNTELTLPVEVISTAAGGVLTWLQAKKHNELASSYSLTAYEISTIFEKNTTISVAKDLSDFVLSSEAAFSREHTQWAARRT